MSAALTRQTDTKEDRDNNPDLSLTWSQVGKRQNTTLKLCFILILVNKLNLGLYLWI